MTKNHEIYNFGQNNRYYFCHNLSLYTVVKILISDLLILSHQNFGTSSQPFFLFLNHCLINVFTTSIIKLVKVPLVSKCQKPNERAELKEIYYG